MRNYNNLFTSTVTPPMIILTFDVLEHVAWSSSRGHWEKKKSRLHLQCVNASTRIRTVSTRCHTNLADSHRVIVFVPSRTHVSNYSNYSAATLRHKGIRSATCNGEKNMRNQNQSDLFHFGVAVGTTKVLPSNSAAASLHLLELVGKDRFSACERTMFCFVAGSFVGHPWILRNLG